MLSPRSFFNVVKNTQLVSVDLLVYDDNDRLLLGRRKNRPAQNTLFVPGGKVWKGEQLLQGAQRLLNDELGIESEMKLDFHSVNDHIYTDNFTGEGLSTHYVCVSFQTKLGHNKVDENVFLKQHSELVWLTPQEMRERTDVHHYTMRYIDSHPLSIM